MENKCEGCGADDPKFVVVQEDPQKILCANCMTDYIESSILGEGNG